jgi:iron-sulfur cluster repair protein YtfE (RIC family)
LQENNFILARSQEHKHIFETLGEMEAGLKFSTAADMVSELKKLTEPFKTRIKKHHSLEEQVIFAAGLETMPSSRIVTIILQLQKEHGIFEKTVDNITFALYHAEEANKSRLFIEHQIKALIQAMKNHSLIEVKTLFPLLSKNPRCKDLIESKSAKTDS